MEEEEKTLMKIIIININNNKEKKTVMKYINNFTTSVNAEIENIEIKTTKHSFLY